MNLMWINCCSLLRRNHLQFLTLWTRRWQTPCREALKVQAHPWTWIHTDSTKFNHCSIHLPQRLHRTFQIFHIITCLHRVVAVPAVVVCRVAVVVTIHCITLEVVTVDYQEAAIIFHPTVLDHLQSDTFRQLQEAHLTMLLSIVVDHQQWWSNKEKHLHHSNSHLWPLVAIWICHLVIPHQLHLTIWQHQHCWAMACSIHRHQYHLHTHNQHNKYPIKPLHQWMVAHLLDLTTPLHNNIFNLQMFRLPLNNR